MTMTDAVRFHQHGGPQVLTLERVELPPPGPGEVRLRQVAIGLNFVDTYQRSGLYPVPLPAIAGNEGAGVIEAVGDGVRRFDVGDRVAYASVAGAYCAARNIAAERLCRLPESIDFPTAAAMMLKGMTAQYLIRASYRAQAGDTVLVHAAAGGVGLIACQWLRALGVTVIGTAGSEEKCALARAHGAAHCIDYRREDFVARVRALTDGEGVAAVYDSVGAATFDGSLDCLRRLGTMVTFGNASGPVPPVAPATLAAKGSLFLTRPLLGDYIASRKALEAVSGELFDVVARGDVRIAVGRRYPLADAAQAHRDMEARLTTGSGILLV